MAHESANSNNLEVIALLPINHKLCHYMPTITSWLCWKLFVCVFCSWRKKKTCALLRTVL